MKKIISLLLVSIIAAGLLSASESVLPQTENQTDRTTVKVGFITNAPYLMQCDQETGYRSGYCYDYLQMIANFTGWNYEYVYGEWHELYLKLVNGEIDMLQDVSYSPDRKNLILFPDAPMGNEYYYLYIQNGNSKIREESLIKDLAGKKIGVTDGSVQKKMLLEWLSNHEINCRVVSLTSDVQRDQNFENGFLDAVVCPEESSKPEWEPVTKIGSTDYYLALAKKQTARLLELNNALSLLNAVHPQFTDELFYKYYSHSTVSRRITSGEKNYVDELTAIKAGYCDDFTTGLSENNSGTIKTIFDRIAGNVGIPKEKIKYTYFKTYDEMLQALQNGEVQVIYPVCALPGAAEKDNYSLIAEISSIPSLVFTKRNAGTGNIKKLGTLSSSGSFYHAKRCFPDAEIVSYTSPEKMLNELDEGKIDGATMPEMIYKIILKLNKKYGKFDTVKAKEDYPTAIACKKGDVNLFTLTERGISLLDKNFIPEVISANSRQNTDSAFENFFKNNQIVVFIVILLILILICSFVIAESRKIILQQKYDMEKELREDLAEALHITEEHQKREKELIYLSEKDSLTGIQNRGAEGKIRQYMDIGTKGMLCLIDIDDFKKINEKYGHAAGDKVLVETAGALKNACRDSDIILRLGSDEFGVFAMGISEKEKAEAIINRFFENLNGVEIPEMEGGKFSVSAGAAFIPSKTPSRMYDEYYSKADAACSKSKKSEGNSFCISD